MKESSHIYLQGDDKAAHCVPGCTTVDAGRSRNQAVGGKDQEPENVKVRQDDAETERQNSTWPQRNVIPLYFIFKNCHSKISNNWQRLFFSDLFFLHFSLFLPLSLLPQHFYLSLHYPSKLVAFQHLCSHAHKVNFIFLTWTFEFGSWMSGVRLVLTGCCCIFHWRLFSQL